MGTLSHACTAREVMHQAAHPVFLLDQILGPTLLIRAGAPCGYAGRTGARCRASGHRIALGRTLTDADKLFGFSRCSGFKLLSRTWWA